MENFSFATSSSRANGIIITAPAIFSGIAPASAAAVPLPMLSPRRKTGRLSVAKRFSTAAWPAEMKLFFPGEPSREP